MPVLRVAALRESLQTCYFLVALVFLGTPALVFAGPQRTATGSARAVLLTGSNPTLEPAELRQATLFQDQLFFLKYDQLWRSDGTVEQSAIVSEVEGYKAIEKLLATDDHLFLFHSIYGLWISEGTTQSTRRLTQKRMFDETILTSDSTLYLWKEPAAELWATDGTSAPELVHAFPEGSVIEDSHAEGENACFLVRVPIESTRIATNQRQVWCSDGPTALTEILGPEGPWDDASSVAMFGDQVLVWEGFFYEESVSVWAAPLDGVGARALLTSYSPVSSGGHGTIRFGSDLYFFAGWDIWRTDGSPGGTALAISLPPLTVWDDAYFVGATDSKLFYEYNRSSPNGGYFASNGTAGGTGLILATAGQRVSTASADSEHLYFSVTGSYSSSAADVRGDSETGLWRSDGTNLGTERIGQRTGKAYPVGARLLQIDSSFGGGLWEINDGRDIELATGTIPVGRATVGTLWQWVGANTGDRAVAATDYRVIWGTDGTAQGTEILRQGDVIGTPRSASQGAIFSFGYEVLSSDGTSAGTSTIGAGSTFDSAPEPPLLYFWNNQELWQTDGSPAGTLLTANVSPRINLGGLRSIGGRIVFKGSNSLWALDGDPGDEIEELAGPFNQGFLNISGEGDPPRATYLFGTFGEIWSSDGTMEGTGLIGAGSGAYADIYLDDANVIYRATNEQQEEEIWLADGSLDGAQLVPGGPWPIEETALPGVAIAYTDDSGEDLWSIPGNWEDAVPLELEEGPGHGVYFRTATVQIGEYLYFAGYRRDTGVELFRTDGTSTPELVIDLNPGPAPGVQKAITTVPGHLVVAGDDGTTGIELWAIQVGPFEFFADDFESGDTTAWTSKSP